MEGELLYKKNFDIDKLIEYAYFYRPKFYKEFIEQFDSKETIETTIKLSLNIEEDKYKFYYYGEYRYRYNTMIMDLGIQYEIYKNEIEFHKDYHESEVYKNYHESEFSKNSHISF